MKKVALVVGVALGIIGITSMGFVIYWIMQDSELFHYGTNLDAGKASNIGSFIGGFVGVFLSGAGFLLIYSTFLEQSEFNVKQTKLFNKQQFETTFFNMLNTYRSLVEMMEGEVYFLTDDSESTSKSFKGYEYFHKVLNQLKNNPLHDSFIAYIEEDTDIPEIKYNKDNNKDNKVWGKSIYSKHKGLGWFKPLNLSKEFYVALYAYYYRVNSNRLGHYFRFIYNIIKFCIEERHDNGDDKRYIDILQAQISNDELGLIFYNALSKYGRTGDKTQRFLNWLDYFDFFENLDSDSLHDREHHNYYSTLFKFLTKEEKDNKRKNHPKPELILP